MKIKAETLLVWLLRLFGIATLCALPTVFMPLSWMDWCHRRIGLGPLPEGPIFEYLARSTSAFYAILGGIILICAQDLRRYSAIITYIAVICIVAGIGVTVLDAMLSLPLAWTLSEGPMTIATGIVILILQARINKTVGD
jgi:hypothetical protein